MNNRPGGAFRQQQHEQRMGSITREVRHASDEVWAAEWLVIQAQTDEEMQIARDMLSAANRRLERSCRLF